MEEVQRQRTDLRQSSYKIALKRINPTDGHVELYYISYKEYLLTDVWDKLRKKILQRDGHRCVICNSNHHLHVHHRTYENCGAEDDNDLVTLCSSCHKTFHRIGILK